MIRPDVGYPVQVLPCTSRIVRVRLGDAVPGVASYLPSHDWPEVACRHTAERIDTGELTVSVSADGITFGDRDGHARLIVSLEQTQLKPRLLVRLQIIGEQHFYGLGEGGPQFDRLGAVRRFWNFQVNRGQGADIAMPLLLSQAGYGVFFDCSAAATLAPGDAGDGTWLEYRSAANSLDLYFIGGSGMREVLGDVATLLGRATLPPRWALGYMQSSRHFVDAAEVRDLAAQFRARRLPCDALIFLSSYGTAKGWNEGVGHLTFQPDVFGEAGTMLGELQSQHFHVITHEYPVLHESSPLFAEAERNGYLLDTAYPRLLPLQPDAPVYKDGQRLIDFSQPAARTWWWQAHAALREAGIAGWWLDGGEGPPASAELRDGAGEMLHNRYDLLRQQAFADGEAADRPDARPFLLCRSGGPGMQRFGAMPWSGDINATFASLDLQIRTGLNAGMSGVPHWGTDTGGFYRVGDNDPELFVRWFQFSAFCSLFRGHGHVWRQHLPWAHGAAIEATCRRYMELRSRLMPYTYSLAWQARMQGLPMMRPLVLNYPDDPAVWDLGTQYLWGDDILVAPVTRKGATQWTVYLPGGVWFDYWTHQRYQGPGGVTVAAPLDRLPLFVRAGAVVPMGPVKQYDAEAVDASLVLRVYPGRDGTFALYEDDGRSNAYLDGGYSVTELRCRSEAGRCAVSVGGATDRVYAVQIPTERAPVRVWQNGGGAVEWWFDGTFVCVRLAGKVVDVHLSW